MEKKVRLGIIGLGNMGSGHLENILNDKCPEVEVTAVCDLNPARLEFALGRLAMHRTAKPDNGYVDIATFPDGDEMFASGLIVGESIVGVVLAGVIVASVTNGGSEAPLAIVGKDFAGTAEYLGLAVFAASLAIFSKIVLGSKKG